MLFNPTTRNCNQIDYIIAVDPGAKNVGLALFKQTDGFIPEFILVEVETADSIDKLKNIFNGWGHDFPYIYGDKNLLVFEKPFSKMNADTYAKTCMSVGLIIAMADNLFGVIGYDYIACVSNNITLGKPKNDMERINNACRMFGQCGDVHGASAIGAGITYINKHGGMFIK